MRLLANLRPVRAWIFGTDGMIVGSAQAHAAAWEETLDSLPLAHRRQEQRRPLGAEEDRRWAADGRSPFDEAAAILASRGLDLPAGSPGDPPGTATVWGVAEEKDRRFAETLRKTGVAAWPGTVRLLRTLARRDIPCAAVSASRYARELLASAGVVDYLRTIVDGNEAARLRLPGKPDPALFVEAARRLGELIEATAVVEDAPAGVEAGRRGGFGLVVGVNRTAGPERTDELCGCGADLVVEDLDELLVGEG